ncbi:MAG: hypothetical protein JW751_27630 [Polyangiaceae bacterium]|nr:hypothetical protein [Polyangiaceae bacterium]
MTRPNPAERAASATDAVAEPIPELVLVALDPEVARFPDECAGCSGYATTSEIVGRGARSVVVPYCTECLRRSSAARTRELATVIASVVMTAAVAGGAPLVWPWAGPVALSLGAVFASAAPVVATCWLLPRFLPRLARLRAVFFTWRGELAFRRPLFAERVAALNGSKELRGARRVERPAVAVLAGPVLAMVAGPVLYYLHHPLVRVLNLHSETAFVEVDGHFVAKVLGSSIESPAAGVDVRIPAGRRQIVARSRSGMVDDDRVLVRGGRHHLYAPGTHDYCFWLETMSYGRDGPPGVGRRSLDPAASFWVLPRKIDAWFATIPASRGEARWSGGDLTALRQARCRNAPGPSGR